MLELVGLSPIATILLVLAIAGVVSWGVTQLVKTTILWWRREFHDDWWFNLLIRSIALIIGGVMGYLMLPEVVGAALGMAGGVLNTSIVMIVKSKLKSIPTESAQDPSDEPPTPGV